VRLTVIIAAAMFVLSLLGSTAFVVVRAPKPAPKPAAEHAVPAVKVAPKPAPSRQDSARAAGTLVAAESTGVPGAASALRSAPVAADAAPQGDRSAPLGVPASATARQSAATYAEVAKLLSSMKPVGAAAILERLSDDQVEGILRSLGVRQASTLLATMPPERAAEMSRRLMVSAPAAGNP
jgi:hypothetical protein